MPARIVMRAVLVMVTLIAACGGSPLFALCDTTAPTLTDFTFTPQSVDTSGGSRTVTVTMTVADALSGVADANCKFTSPDGRSVACDATTPATGTPQSGSFTCVVTLPRYAASGVWTAYVTIDDAVENIGYFDPSEIGAPSMLDVASDPDAASPSLSAVSFSPGAINVSAGPGTATCAMTLADPKSGVDFASCQLFAPDSQQSAGCVTTVPSSGTRNNGVFSCAVTIPQFADAGAWTTKVSAQDLAGNPLLANPSATLAVSDSAEDIVVPSLTSFDFGPTTISVGAAARPVVCTMDVADFPAGVNTATCTFGISTFVPPADFVNQTQSCTANAPVSGTRNSGRFQCIVLMPRYAAAGTWSSDVQLDDLAGNTIDDPQAGQLNVDCSAVVPEPACRFASHQSLTWDSIPGAAQYDVYRGPLTNLVDANADHVPDGGYGTCQNSRDGNLADTTFLDTDVPTTAQKGFFYLVAYKSGGVEYGLGANGFGTPRTVTPCP